MLTGSNYGINLLWRRKKDIIVDRWELCTTCRCSLECKTSAVQLRSMELRSMTVKTSTSYLLVVPERLSWMNIWRAKCYSAWSLAPVCCRQDEIIISIASTSITDGSDLLSFAAEYFRRREELWELVKTLHPRSKWMQLCLLKLVLWDSRRRGKLAGF